jgi:hypothetical protein
VLKKKRNVLLHVANLEMRGMWFSVFTPDYARLNIEWFDAGG